MVKKNWSILVVFLLVIVLILINNIQRVVPLDRRVEPARLRGADFIPRDFEGNFIRAGANEKMLSLPPEDILCSEASYDGVLFFTLGRRGVQQADAMEYALISYYYTAEELLRLQEAIPFRLEIVGADDRHVLLLQQFSNRSAVLRLYGRSSGALRDIKRWDEFPEGMKICYSGGLITLGTKEGWEIYNSIGHRMEIEYDLPEGARTITLGASGDTVIIYYEADQLRFVKVLSLTNRKSRSFLVKERINRFIMLSQGVLAELDLPGGSRFQHYRLKDLSNERWSFDRKVEEVSVINDRLVSVSYREHQLVHLVIDALNHQLMAVNRSPLNIENWQAGAQGNTALYYVSPIKSFQYLRFDP